MNTVAMSPKQIDFFAAFATDLNLEVKGALAKIHGINFYVARMGNKEYGKLLKELVEKNQTVLDQKDDEADAKSDEIMVEVFARTILTGWDGEVPFNGGTLPHSIENAKTLLAMKDFRSHIARLSDERERYAVVKAANEVKN
jgi:hypothetical protein